MKSSEHTTWVLIADAAHADVLVLNGARQRLAPVPGMACQQHVPRWQRTDS